jgi:hypothetical protein
MTLHDQLVALNACRDAAANAAAVRSMIPVAAIVEALNKRFQFDALTYAPDTYAPDTACGGGGGGRWCAIPPWE